MAIGVMGARFCGTIGRRQGKGVPIQAGLAISGVSNARASESIFDHLFFWLECLLAGWVENADNAAKKWIGWCISTAMLSRSGGCHNFSRIAASSGNPAMTVFNLC